MLGTDSTHCWGRSDIVSILCARDVLYNRRAIQRCAGVIGCSHKKRRGIVNLALLGEGAVYWRPQVDCVDRCKAPWRPTQGMESSPCSVDASTDGGSVGSIVGACSQVLVPPPRLLTQPVCVLFARESGAQAARGQVAEQKCKKRQEQQKHQHGSASTSTQPAKEATE